MRRSLVVIVAALGLVAGGLASNAADAATANPPDLGMDRLTGLSIERSGGRTLLRFSATVVNVGLGDFIVHAERTSTSASFSGVQRIEMSDGQTSTVETAAQFVFAGDGHSHWHVKDLERYDLQRLDNGVKVGTGAKGGFCFFDTTPYRLTLPGAPENGVYGGAGCGGQQSLTLDMGLSVGWGDTYGYWLPDQYIDITGLGAGRYRLVATADPHGQFVESNESNNTTWVDLQIKGNGARSVKITGYGPTA